jgi:hypothetical protein
MIRHRSAFAAVFFLVLGPVSAFAQTQIRFVEYSAKFLCGTVDVQAPAAAAVRPGIYETSINIHNPQLPVTPLPSVTFVKKVVLALPEGEKPVPPSQFRRDVLQADFAEQVNCKIIRGMLGPAGAAPFVEGFVVLIVFPAPLATSHELDVVGVYTVNTPQQSISLEMVPVAPRLLTLPTAAGARLRDKLMKESKKPE